MEEQEFRGWIADIALSLPLQGAWGIVPERGGSNCLVLRDEDDGLELAAWLPYSGRKVEFSVVVPRYGSAYRFSDYGVASVPPISVSSDRDPAAAAKDVARRLIKLARPAVAQVRQVIAERQAQYTKSEATANALAAALGYAREVEPHDAGVPIFGLWSGASAPVRADVRVSYGRVDLKLNELTETEALRVIGYVNEMRLTRKSALDNAG